MSHLLDEIHNSGKRQFGWGQHKFPCEENVRWCNRGIPSIQNSSQHQHMYESRYNCNPTNTLEVASSSKALESASTLNESSMLINYVNENPTNTLEVASLSKALESASSLNESGMLINYVNENPTNTLEVASLSKALESASSLNESGMLINYVNENPTNTSEVASSSKALESASNLNESVEDGKIQFNDITSSYTKPASSVETEKSSTSTSQKALKEKKKKAKSSSTRRKKSKKKSNPIFHITWDDFSEEECETVGQVCPLCEEDLSFAPEDDTDNEYYEQIDGPQNYPQVSVLACGHVFHNACLSISDEQCTDPICCICLSCEGL